MSAVDCKDYFRNRILQSSPEQLQLILYDGAIRFVLEGREAILRKDHEAAYEKLSRAQNIVLELQAGLRPEVNRELCERMSALYDFIYRKLVRAGVRRDVSDLDDAVKILRYQRETWNLLLEKIAQAQGNDAPDACGAAYEPGSLSVEG